MIKIEITSIDEGASWEIEVSDFSEVCWETFTGCTLDAAVKCVKREMLRHQEGKIKPPTKTILEAAIEAGSERCEKRDSSSFGRGSSA